MMEPVQATSDDPTRYNNSHKYTGTAVIICNVEFKGGLGTRNVALKDVERLEPVLKQKGFRVFSFINLSAIEMQKQLEIVAGNKEYHEESDSFLCVLSSHGDWDSPGDHSFDVIYGSDEKLVNIRVLTNTVTPKKCPQLAGKPKIFLMQCCRGDSYQISVDVKSNVEDNKVVSAAVKDAPGSKFLKLEGTAGVVPEDYSIPYEIPIKRDFLIHYATTPGYVSFKKAGKGTPFLQAWCDVFEKSTTDLLSTDLLSMTTIVNAKVAEEYESNAPSRADQGLHLRKQMPQAVSMLTKEFYFTTKTLTA